MLKPSRHALFAAYRNPRYAQDPKGPERSKGEAEAAGVAKGAAAGIAGAQRELSCFGVLGL